MLSGFGHQCQEYCRCVERHKFVKYMCHSDVYTVKQETFMSDLSLLFLQIDHFCQSYLLEN